jgi:hypothetical protein
VNPADRVREFTALAVEHIEAGSPEGRVHAALAHARANCRSEHHPLISTALTDRAAKLLEAGRMVIEGDNAAAAELLRGELAR